MRIATRICTISALLAGAAFGCHSNCDKAASAGGESPPVMGPGSLRGVPRNQQNDVLFMRTTAMADLTAIELGNLAADKGASKAVREFGRLMADDHATADAELIRIASSEGISLPTTLDAEHRAEVNDLASLTGDAFDSAYMSMTIRHHQDAITAFDRESEQGTILAARRFAEQTIPMLSDHLMLAHRTQAIASAEEH